MDPQQSEPTEERRTKRRYAHELYPHGPEDEVRDLAVEVPYLYARAWGFEVGGTGWFDADPRTLAGERTQHLIAARERAFIADALLQGLTGQEAWQWAEERAQEESAEWVLERGRLYGVDFDAIKPYPCGPEPEHHQHSSERDEYGSRTVTYAAGKESECEQCTEVVPSVVLS